MEYEFCHSGIKGMKWGIRRYQNPDGSLTAAGRAHYGVGGGRGGGSSAVKSHSRQFKGKDQKHAIAKEKRIEARQSRKAARIAEKNARKEAERKREQDAKELQRYEELRRKPASKLTAAEMQELTTRLMAEKTYKELLRQTEDPKLFDSKKFVADVLQDSGKKILSGVLTYGAGKAINELFGDRVFNVGNDKSHKQKAQQDDEPESKPKNKLKQKQSKQEQPKQTEPKQESAAKVEPSWNPTTPKSFTDTVSGARERVSSPDYKPSSTNFVKPSGITYRPGAANPTTPKSFADTVSGARERVSSPDYKPSSTNFIFPSSITYRPSTSSVTATNNLIRDVGSTSVSEIKTETPAASSFSSLVRDARNRR